MSERTGKMNEADRREKVSAEAGGTLIELNEIAR